MSCAFLDRYSNLDSPVHRLDARVKILAFVALVVTTVSTPATAVWALCGYLAMTATYILVSRVPIRYVFTRSLVAVPFVLFVAIFVPFLKSGGGSYSLGFGGLSVSRSGLLIVWNCLIKSYIAILAIIGLSSTTSFPDLLKGLERMKTPSIVIMLLSFTYRYIFVLVDEVLRMRRARDARGYDGRWLWHAKVIGQMIGMLFLRSYERGERVYLAMVSRGFQGRAVGAAARKIRAADLAFLVLSIAISALLRVGLS